MNYDITTLTLEEKLKLCVERTAGIFKRQTGNYPTF